VRIWIIFGQWRDEMALPVEGGASYLLLFNNNN
jgi:hypothetical protein